MLQHQPFDDIIIETLAKSGENKTLEMRLFWCLALIGILISYCIVRLLKKKTHHTIHKELPAFLEACPILILPNLFQLIVFGSFSKPLLILVVLLCFYHIFLKEQSISALAFSVLTYYAVMGISTLLCVTGHAVPPHLFLLSMLVSALCVLILTLSRKKAYLSYCILYIQPFITGVLSLYFVDDYFYNNARINVPYAKGYYIFFITLTLILLVWQLLHCIRNTKQATSLPLASLISRASATIIFIYNSYSACPMFAQPDQHHHGEQMIPWQQIITLGQKAYEEYTPVSGLFPMVIGFIQNVVLGGTISDYSPAVSIFMVCICLLTMCLIYEHVGGMWALAISVLFCLPCYNRQYLVLPLLLLLTLPKLYEKANLWLSAWLFGCFLAGLYYPLFGAAVLLGTLPFAIYQIRNLLKQKDRLKHTSTYVPLLIVLVPICFSIPLLLRMLRHTLTYSNQTTLADGIALHGQSVPEFFMPYLNGHAFLQTLCYFGIRIFLPMCGLILFAIMTFRTKESKRKLFYLSGLISLAISYSYTLVRADTGVILSRTSYILVALCGIFLPILLLNEYQKERMPLLPFLLIGILFSLPSMLYQNIAAVKTPAMWVYPNGESALYFDDESKLFDVYEVNDVFAKSEDTGFLAADQKRLGPGFMVKDQLDYVKQYRAIIDKCERIAPDTTYFGFDGQGFYSYLGVKCCYTGFIPAAKGYAAQVAIRKRMSETRPVIFLIEPESNYYLYYYMMTNDYIYDEEDACYYPKELYQKLYPKENPSNVRRYENISPLTLGKVASSFGNSFDALKPLMTSESEFTFHFAGTDYDMIYAQLDTSAILDAAVAANATPPSTITVDFACEGEAYPGSHVTCDIGDGTLLIPVGMNLCWLQAKDISHISFSFDSDANSSMYAPCIKELKLYKIRQ